MMIRKYILGLVALFLIPWALFLTPLVLWLELAPSAHAAFAIFQTYAVPATPQIFYNIVSDGGAACNGDKQTVTLTVSTPPPFSPNLTVFSNQFTGGDVGKAIKVPGAGNGGGDFTGVIQSVGAWNGTSQVVVMTSNFGTQLTSASKSVTYGTNDASAFATFNTWARANQGSSNQVVLTIPNGSNCWFGSGVAISGFSDNFWSAGINNLLVEGTGATIDSVDGYGFQLAGLGTCFVGLTPPGGCSARIQTVSAGASTVSLTADSYAAGYISRFSVGTRVLVGGLDPQALFDPNTGYGDPVNLWAFEWKTITAICNNTGACPGAAVITLDSALTDSLSSQWPEYNDGDAFHSDGAGPASIWALDPSWETTVEYRGLTISQEGQTYAQGRNVTYRGVTFTGAHGAIPTQNETFSAINTDYGFTNMETDKLVTNMVLDGVTIAKIVNQSTATKRLIIRNSTFTIGLDGGARYTEISDTNLGAWAPGIGAYGSLGLTDSTTCTRCTITSINFGYGASSSSASDFNYFTMAGGVITMPNGGAQGSGPGQRYFVPGAIVYYGVNGTNPPISFACCESIGSFQVSTITGDPWPALDNQTLSTTVNITSATKALNVPAGPFVSGDVGKTIIIGGAGDGGGNLRTIITGYSSATNVTLYNNASTSVSGTQTIQWGTSNTYITTNQAGGFPNISALSTSPVFFATTGVPNITCDVCNAGDPTSNGYGISIQAGATPGAPLGAHMKKQYTPASAAGALSTVNARGVFQSLSIDVTVAATSTGAVTLNPGGQFHWFMIDQNTPTAPVPFDWLPGDLSINLKQTGNRVITPSGVTCNGLPGACSGDTINRPANLGSMWVQFGTMGPYMGSTHTGAPTFTITMETDPIQ